MTAVVAPNGDGGSNVGGLIALRFPGVTRLEDLQCPGSAVEVYQVEELIQIKFPGLPGIQEQGDAIVPRVYALDAAGRPGESRQR
jgi:hypothetical protein